VRLSNTAGAEYAAVAKDGFSVMYFDKAVAGF
jgi:hypothetical protein